MNEIRDLKDLEYYEKVIMSELAKGSKVGYTDIVRTLQCYYIPNERKEITCRVASEDGTEYFHGKQAICVLMQNRNFRKTVRDYVTAIKKETESGRGRNGTIPTEYFAVHPDKEPAQDVIEANGIGVAAEVKKVMDEEGTDFERAWADVSFGLKEKVVDYDLIEAKKKTELANLSSLVNAPGEDTDIKPARNTDEQNLDIDNR